MFIISLYKCDRSGKIFEIINQQESIKLFNEQQNKNRKKSLKQFY